MSERVHLRVCLASASPRRRDLLMAAGIAFTVVPADIDGVQSLGGGGVA